jgi:ABC-type polar amino acid transport system ATPase subunit
MGLARAAADRIVMMDDGGILAVISADRMIASPVHERTRRFLSQIVD